jgi:hypothetical protein
MSDLEQTEIHLPSSGHPYLTLGRIDAALDEIQRLREQVMVQAPSPDRFVRLAELADSEARWWLRLVEHSHTRVYWRAALSAHEHARLSARNWRRVAATQRQHHDARSAA